jgi:DNA-binding CsgD family transcriptional regulator
MMLSPRSTPVVPTDPIPFHGFASAFGLSAQECAVLAGGMEGWSMKETAARLDISAKTVETYWRRIYEKTGGRTQLEVVARLVHWVLAERSS